MKNIYALDKKLEIIKISNAIKQERYSCLNCKNELIPKLGKIRQHHFAHKHTSCNYETYLHKLGKLSFYNSYTKALKNKIPFYAEYFSQSTCNSCKKTELNLECEFKTQIKKYDLTKYFDIIEKEKGINGFIADILLSSSSKKEKILIEIAISHFCEQEKINSGLKIIEFHLQNETDIKLFNRNVITQNNNHIKFYNFKRKIINNNIYNPNNCSKRISVFKVLKNGKAIRDNLPISKVFLEKNNQSKYLEYKIIQNNSNEFGSMFIDFVKDTSLKGIDVKNCYACRFSVKNDHEYASTNLMCRKHNKEIENSNEAINCKKFWKIKDKTPFSSKYRKSRYNDWR